MGILLHVHRAERADRLVEPLAAVLRERGDDPFAPDVVAVPTRGVERWLAQRLSHTLGAADDGDEGICAHVEFPSPAELLGQVLTRAAGLDPDQDPWHPRRLVWTVLRLLDDCAGEPWCAVLGAHLGVSDGDPLKRGRRFATAQRLTRLFESYAADRPGMLLAWAAGEDTDGTGTALPPAAAWQAELWRRLRARVGTPGPAERLAGACAALRADPRPAGLPDRLSVFGPTRLAAADLDLLGALAEGRDVHLWLPHPSPALWDRVAPYAAAAPAGPRRRREDPTADLPRHPLLSSLGRDSRELQLRLGGTGAPASDDYHPGPPEPDTLLGRLQRDLRTDTAPPGAPVGGAEDRRPALAPGDRSVVVHACHGPDRQVEVLRDALLGLLAADETLEPRDILVMCPDIETFAPLISASFGLGDEDGAAGHPAHRLRVRLADRALREVNPLLGTLARLLELAAARVTAPELLDLLASPPVRHRFRLDEDDLERLRDLVQHAQIRWGLDADHRGAFQLGSFGQNTWSAGLDRLLLGVAMSEDDEHWIGTALPLDDVDSADADLVGRLAEFVDRVTAVIEDLAGERPLTAWTDALIRALDDLTDVAPPDAWQAVHARAVLADLAGTAEGPTAPLTLADVRTVLADRLRGRPTRANFRTGTLTMCTMMPMRSVPHRVVCLLGLDDGVFPRTGGADGDDVLALDPCTGERDPRGEDRQLLLDALFAATEQLVVVHSGADERTNGRRPPAVPLDELLDTVDATVRSADGRPAREHVVLRHPLQPFDPRNYTPGALGAPRPFSFDRAGLAGAEAANGPRRPAPPFLTGPLPPDPAADEIELDDLVRFVQHPVKAFLRQRLGVGVFDPEDALADGLPVSLDGLEKWNIGDRLLRARLRGAPPERCQGAEWRRGTLPPGALGRAVLGEVAADVEQLVAAAAPLLVAEPAARDVVVPLPGGGRVVGTVPNLRDGALVTVVFSRLGPKHRLRAWVELLALTAATDPAADAPPPRAVVIGRVPRGTGALRSVLGPVDPGQARVALADLADLHRLGRCEPLPLPTQTANAYAERRMTGDGVEDATFAAAKKWTDHTAGERRDGPYEVVWGRRPDFGVLGTDPARTDERGPWPQQEPTRFGALAMRLWAPLLAAETVERA